MKTLIKILSVLGILIGGLGVSCGGYMSIVGENKNFSSYIGFLEFMIIGGILSLIFGIWKIFIRNQGAKNQSDKRQEIFFLITKIIILFTIFISISEFRFSNTNIVLFLCALLLIISQHYNTIESYWNNRKKIIPKNISLESLDLMNSLSEVNISDVSSVTFSSIGGESFTLDTENIKRLVVYITGHLQKTEFAQEELRVIYNHVCTYIQSELDIQEKEKIQEKIEDFVKNGGKITIEKNTHQNQSLQDMGGLGNKFKYYSRNFLLGYFGILFAIYLLSIVAGDFLKDMLNNFLIGTSLYNFYKTLLSLTGFIFLITWGGWVLITITYFGIHHQFIRIITVISYIFMSILGIFFAYWFIIILLSVGINIGESLVYLGVICILLSSSTLVYGMIQD